MNAPSTKTELLDRVKALAENHGSDGYDFVCGDLEAALEAVIDLLPDELIPNAWKEIREQLMERQGLDEQNYQEWEERYRRRLAKSQ